MKRYFFYDEELDLYIEVPRYMIWLPWIIASIGAVLSTIATIISLC